jgi:CRP-like cAMP-binding protein
MNATNYQIDTYVLDTLMRDLVAHDRRPSAFLVYLTLSAAAAQGRVAMSYAQMAEHTGLSRRAVQDAVALLRRRALVSVARNGPTETATYQPLRPWARS